MTRCSAPDGSLWFLMPVGEHDQLFRMAIGGAPVQVSNFTDDVGGFRVAPSGDRVVVWADRDLRCADLNCAGLPPKPKTGSGRTYDQLFIRHWDTWAEPGVAFASVRIRARRRQARRQWRPADRQSGRRYAVQAVRRRRGDRLLARRAHGLFHSCAKPGGSSPSRPTSTSSRCPATARAPPVNLTDANDATDTLPAVSPDGRTLAYVAMARPAYESDRQVLMLRDLATGQYPAADAGIGTARSVRSNGRRTAGACWSPPATRSKSRCSGSMPRPARSRA